MRPVGGSSRVAGRPRSQPHRLGGASLGREASRKAPVRALWPAGRPTKKGAEPKPDAGGGTSLVQGDEDQAAFIVRRPTRTASPGQLNSLHRGPRRLMAGSANPRRVYKIEA